MLRVNHLCQQAGWPLEDKRMTAPTTPSDLDLLRLMMAGDETAFTALFRRRQGSVYRFALQMSGSPAIAEDVTQEVFLVLMREGHRYDPERASLAAYLYGIARNHVLRRLDEDRPFVPLPESAEDQGAAVPAVLITESDPLDRMARDQMIDALRVSILALPAHYREVVVLCDLHEMSYVEAANVIGCAVGTIRSRLHRARGLLIEKLRGNNKAAATTELLSSTRCFA